MKNGFICAATREELETFGLEGAEPIEENQIWKIPEGYAAVTGVGIPVAMLRLPVWIDRWKPDWILNFGIAGAYTESGLAIGDLVAGASEVFGDLGFELPDDGVFRPLSEAPFADPLLKLPLALHIPDWIRIRPGKGATVNRCTGREGTGRMRRKIFDADFESMEGAAVALAGVAQGIPVVEIRAISNFASDRDMRPENIQSALKSLREFWRENRKFLN